MQPIKIGDTVEFESWGTRHRAKVMTVSRSGKILIFSPTRWTHIASILAVNGQPYDADQSDVIEGQPTC